MSPDPASPNVTRHTGHVSPAERAARLGQRGCVVWLTGLSGSGKSTLAYALERRLVEAGRVAFVLDGDNLRHGLCGDLGFSPGDRRENIRRAGHVAALMADAGVVCVASFVSPYRGDRLGARRTVGEERFLEVHLDTPLEVCERRDPKGLYRRARAGELRGFTGVDAPYEAPVDPELALPTHELDLDACVARVEEMLRTRDLLGAAEEPR